jgi:PncC family amidohydrolase
MNELSTLGRQVGELLKLRGDSVAIAESSAGGLISASLLALPGASAYFRGGVVTYTRESRKAFFERDGHPFADVAPSSEAYALALARAARQMLATTWAIGETGASGPTGNSYGYDAGHACIAVAGPVELSAMIETRSALRELNMWSFTAAALGLLEKAIQQAGGVDIAIRRT